jgi:ATP-dependent protease Clp ATPase subunit
MLDVMFEIPSTRSVAKCTITEDTVNEGEPPVLVHSEDEADRETA